MAKGYWYLSFADSDLPEGQQWLGAVIVEEPGDTMGIPAFAQGKGVDGLARAVTLTHVLGINPGGGVKAVGPIEGDTDWLVPYTNRLLTEADIKAMDADYATRKH